MTNTKQCECEGCVVLTDVLTDVIGLQCDCHEEVGELIWWRCYGLQLNVPTVAAHCEKRVSITASITR